MSSLPKIFVETEDSQGIGFIFLHDKKAPHNYIHSECLDFFWGFFETKNEVLSDDDTQVLHLHSQTLPSIDRNRKIVKCYDGKFRRSDIVYFRFVINGNSYNEPFVVDKKLCVAGVLGKNFKHKISLAFNDCR